MADKDEDKKRKQAEYHRIYYRANKEAIKKYNREYYAANRDVLIKYNREYYAANKDAIAERSHAYYEAHKADYNENRKNKKKQKNKKSEEEKKEDRAEYNRAYYEANKAAIAERRRAQREANKVQPSGYRGVSSIPRAGGKVKYMGYFRMKNKYYHTKPYETPDEAKEARDALMAKVLAETGLDDLTPKTKKDEKTTENIPEIIKEARIKKGLTQAQVASALGYKNFQAYQRWELGARPVPNEKKRALANLLDLTVDDLVP